MFKSTNITKYQNLIKDRIFLKKLLLNKIKCNWNLFIFKNSNISFYKDQRNNMS